MFTVCVYCKIFIQYWTVRISDLCGTVQFNPLNLFLFILSDYFEDYRQNQISAIQFSPNGLHLAIVTDGR